MTSAAGAAAASPGRAGTPGTAGTPATARSWVAGLPAPWRTEPLLLAEHAWSVPRAVRVDGDGLLAVLEAPGRPPGALGLGEPAAVARHLAALAADQPELLAACGHLTVPVGTFDLAPPAQLPGERQMTVSSTWDWMCTDGPLTDVAGTGARAERLQQTPESLAQVRALLDQAYPAAHTAPQDDAVLGWWGVHHDGGLVAVAGAVTLASGPAPRLVSVAVDPAWRGRGLAGVTLAAAVEECLAMAPPVLPTVTIALYADNDVARRVYLRHGFGLGHRFESGRRPRPA